MKNLKHAYYTFYNKSDQLYHIFSPYRVCPLGAHVDHQHGVVTGFAFDKGIDFLFSKTNNSKVEMCSLSFEGLISFDMNQNLESRQGNWGDYLRGAVYALKKRACSLQYGIKGVLRGSMPIGGLSSSAAALVGYVMALDKVNGLGLTPIDMIQIASEAEREYVGLKNGILDQACVTLCKQDSLLYLDTRSNEYELIPQHADMPAFELGIFFSGLTRSLVGTDYNLRVSECKTAAWNVLALKGHPLNTLEETFLRDVPEEEFQEMKYKIPHRFAKRATHFYSECERVHKGVEARKAGNLSAFGQLIFESCESSIHNYECGSDELIALYDIMREVKGIYGGRFSGAGFKGACITLVNPHYKKEIEEQITEAYLARFPQYKNVFEVFFCQIDGGARFVEV